MSSTIFSRGVVALGAFVTGSLFNYYHGPTTIPLRQHSKVQRTAGAEHDRITNLPGLYWEPNFDQFSGYLDSSPTRHLFYWYVESQNNPDNDPIVFWTNGGPGCSGLLGFGAEHGPYLIDEDGRLHENFYSWNRVANMLYVEMPAGVGYSYVDNAPADKITDDAQTASDNYQFLLSFLDRFPERRSNALFLASESYGGHYMPQLSLEILERNTDGYINFHGFMVGNPYVDPYTNMVAQFESYYSHGLLAKPLFDVWQSTCCNRSFWESDECDKITDSMFDQFGSGVNPYALDYPVCLDDVSAPDDKIKRSKHRHLIKSVDPYVSSDADEEVQQTSSAQVDTLLNRTGSRPPFLPKQDEYKPCSQVNLERYFNRKDVREALHFFKKVEHYKWSPCGGVQYSHEDDMTSVVSLYQELVARGMRGEHDLHMLIYSGDDDSICATAGTQDWLWSLGANATSIWQAWKMKGQVSGFLTRFDLTGGPDIASNATLSFVTVHGAGHEVPAYRPMEALELFDRFLHGIW